MRLLNFLWMSVNREEMITKFIASWTILIFFLLEDIVIALHCWNLGGNYFRVAWGVMDVEIQKVSWAYYVSWAEFHLSWGLGRPNLNGEDFWRKRNLEGTALKETDMQDGEPAEKVSKGGGGKRQWPSTFKTSSQGQQLQRILSSERLSYSAPASGAQKGASETSPRR